MPWTSRRPAPPDAAAAEFLGTLAQVRLYRDNEDGTCWVIADLADGSAVTGEIEARGELKPGAVYRFLGAWREHERHGWQFAFDSCLLDTPDDPDGVAAYLARHADGVGYVIAGRLVAKYGKDAARMLCEDVARVIEDEVLTAEAARAASESLRRVYADPALREAHLQLFQLLRGHGFYAKAIKAALRKWRASAPAQVRRDPFLLMTHGLPGCGFLKTDRLYLALGKPPRRLKRQALAAWHALCQLEGDTWTPAKESLAAVRRQIGGVEPRDKRAVALLCRAGLAEHRTDPAGRVWIAERYKARSERAVAHMLSILRSPLHCWPDAGELGLDPIEDAHQVEQLRGGLTDTVVLLTGSPGTGKTHCAALIIRALVKRYGSERIAVVAPTGKAAVRITEKLQEARLPLQATTIHKRLGVQPVEGGEWGFAHGPDNPLPLDYVVCDETSMCDTGVMACLLSALLPGTHLLLIGDPHQLPPVGHGAPLRDMIAAGLARAHLSEIRRNAGLIVRACHAIKDGKTPKLPAELSAWPQQNLIQVPWGKGEKGTEQGQLLRERLDMLYEWLSAASPPGKEWSLIDDVQVIVARNATRQTLNKHLQARLNAAGEKAPVGQYRVEDKVICLKNGFSIDLQDRNRRQVYVANGDIGRVKGFSGRTMAVQLKSPDRLVGVPLTRGAEEEMEAKAKEALGESGKAAGSWDLAYAITAHKSQGSEMPVVLFVVEGAGKLGSRELVYTAISRAKDLCVVIGDRPDIARYVRNVTLPDRKTFLSEMIRGELPL